MPDGLEQGELHGGNKIFSLTWMAIKNYRIYSYFQLFFMWQTNTTYVQSKATSWIQFNGQVTCCNCLTKDVIKLAICILKWPTGGNLLMWNVTWYKFCYTDIDYVRVYGACHLAAIAGSTILVPYQIVKSVELTRRSQAHKWNLRVPDLLMSCKDLTYRQGTRIVVQVMATRVTDPILFAWPVACQP